MKELKVEELRSGVDDLRFCWCLTDDLMVRKAGVLILVDAIAEWAISWWFTDRTRCDVLDRSWAWLDGFHASKAIENFKRPGQI
jgi:hypothetical protein